MQLLSRFFYKGRNVIIIICFQYTKINRIIRSNRYCSNSDMSIFLPVIINHLSKIDLIKLVTAKYQYILIIVVANMTQALSHSIGCTLKPTWVVGRLFSRQYINKATAKVAEDVR